MGHARQPYLRLLAMAALAFISMYVLMYAMVNVSANVIPNLNQFYMAGLMTARMLMIELVVMRPMYAKRAWNVTILAASTAPLLAFWVGIRAQVAINDREFLKSMIPHHAGAIFMCEEARMTAPEIKDLCATIVTGQQAEIDKMKTWLGKGS